METDDENNVGNVPEVKDAYCWLCHRQKTTIFCCTCIRTFHEKCLKDGKTHDENWQCEECVAINEPGQRLISVQSLKCLMNEIFQNAQNAFLINPLTDAVDNVGPIALVNPMSLAQMKRNIAEGKYTSGRDFLADIEWIKHNTIIALKGNSNKIKIAKQLAKNCADSIENIKMCEECFLNENTHSDYFTMICAKPHMIVWAKLSTYPYWPAKLMRVNENFVRVQFFGDHKYADISVKNCFLYSRSSPRTKNTCSETMNRSLQLSMSEADRYIMNLVDNYGDYFYYNAKMPFDLLNMEAYMHKLTTGAREGCDFPVTGIPERVTVRRVTVCSEIKSGKDMLKAIKPKLRRKSVQFNLDQNRVHEFNNDYGNGNGSGLNAKKPKLLNKPPKVKMSTVNDSNHDNEQSSAVNLNIDPLFNEDVNMNGPTTNAAAQRLPAAVLLRQNDHRHQSTIDTMVLQVVRDMISENFHELRDIASNNFQYNLNNYIERKTDQVRIRMLEMEIEKLKKDHANQLRAVRNVYTMGNFNGTSDGKN